MIWWSSAIVEAMLHLLLYVTRHYIFQMSESCCSIVVENFSKLLEICSHCLRKGKIWLCSYYLYHNIDSEQFSILWILVLQHNCKSILTQYKNMYLKHFLFTLLKEGLSIVFIINISFLIEWPFKYDFSACKELKMGILTC